MKPELLLHIAFMALAAGLAVAAAVTARRKQGLWLKRHRILALAAAAAGLLAFGFIAAFKVSLGFPHFRSPHAIAGAVTLLLLVVTPIAGMLLASGKTGLRIVHRTLGRITVGLLLVTLLMGVLRLIRILK